MKRNYFLSTALGLLLSTGAFAQSEFPCEKLDPILETTEINICKPGGKVVLEAKNSAGNEIFWYDAADSEEPIEIGASFEVDATSDDPHSMSYWVTEAQIEVNTLEGQAREKTAKIEWESTNNKKTMLFTAFEAFTIKEVDVYTSSPAGDVTIELIRLGGFGKIAEKTVRLPDGSGSMDGVQHTISLDFEIPEPDPDASKNKYSLVMDGNVNISLRKELLTANDFPIPIADVGEITGGSGSGFISDPNWSRTYFWFYNWKIEAGGVVCESEPRKEIKINVNDDAPDAPQIDESYILCGDADFTLEDILVEANDLKWYNEDFDELDDDTLIVNGATYLLTDTSVGGCESDYAEVTFTIQDISATPIAEIEQSFEEGSGDTLASLEVEGENLQWYADADKEEELSEETELEDATTYYVTQTLEDHCESETLGITVVETLGIADVVFEGLVYTNPVKDALYLSNNEVIDKVVLYDLTGKEFSFKASNSTSTQVDLSYLSPGTYLLNLSVKGKNKTIRIVKK